jgi:molybdopterin converting factor small subunit
LVRILTVNGKQGNLQTGLSEGDTIFLFPPAFGGG